jgi:hypothetical protein
MACPNARTGHYVFHGPAKRRSKSVDVDHGLLEDMRRFLRRIVSDAAGE